MKKISKKLLGTLFLIIAIFNVLCSIAGIQDLLRDFDLLSAYVELFFIIMFVDFVTWGIALWGNKKIRCLIVPLFFITGTYFLICSMVSINFIIFTIPCFCIGIYIQKKFTIISPGLDPTPSIEEPEPPFPDSTVPSAITELPTESVENEFLEPEPNKVSAIALEVTEKNNDENISQSVAAPKSSQPDTPIQKQPQSDIPEKPDNLVQKQYQVDIPEKTIAADETPQPQIKCSEKKPFREILESEVKKYEYYHVNIFTPDDIDAVPLKLDDYIEFMLEPSNPYDSKAVLLLHDDNKIGYLYRGKIKDLVYDFINQDKTVIAFIDSVNGFNYTVHIGCYENYLDAVSDMNKKTLSLCGLNKDDSCFPGLKRYESLQASTVGDIVTLEYDIVDEKYIAYDGDGNKIGELSVKQSDKIITELIPNEYTILAQIASLDDNRCKVNIFYD